MMEVYRHPDGRNAIRVVITEDGDEDPRDIVELDFDTDPATETRVDGVPGDWVELHE